MKTKTTTKTKVQALSLTALFSLLICLIAPVSIPLAGLVPISLATFAIYLSGALLVLLCAVLSVVVYIILGAAGLPVFSNWEGGLGKLVGVTGGYIIGYIPMVFIISFFSRRFSKKYVLPLSMVAGTAVLYIIGTAWFMFQTKNPLSSALSACVLPFLPGDAAKIAVASAFALSLKKILKGRV